MGFNTVRELRSRLLCAMHQDLKQAWLDDNSSLLSLQDQLRRLHPPRLRRFSQLTMALKHSLGIQRLSLLLVRSSLSLKSTGLSFDNHMTHDSPADAADAANDGLMGSW